MTSKTEIYIFTSEVELINDIETMVTDQTGGCTSFNAQGRIKGMGSRATTVVQAIGVIPPSMMATIQLKLMAAMGVVFITNQQVEVITSL